MAILFALFSSDDMRNVAVNAKASFAAVLPGPSVAAQPDTVQLTAKDIQLKDPARLSAPANMAAGAPPTNVQAPNVQTPGVEARPRSRWRRRATRSRRPIRARCKAARRPPRRLPPLPRRAPPARQLDPDELATLMTRAKGLLAVGDIPPARLLLERAADAQEADRGIDAGADLRSGRARNARMRATSLPIPAGAQLVPAGRPARLGRGAAAPQPNAIALFQVGTSNNATFDWIGTLCHDDGLRLRGAGRRRTEFDPAKVSDSLKAIFQFGSADTKQALNANTVTLISGTIGGTYVQFGADLASVLDDGNKLRVLPIVGRGSVQSVADILFLQGVDLGIVRSDTLDYLEKKGFAKDIKKQFTYVTKLYNEEMHVIASKSIRNLKELDGKTVSVDLPNGGTFVTALTVFERLGIKPNVVYIEQRIAMEKMKTGEIDAVIVVGGKPYKSVSSFKDDRFHLVTVDYAKPLQNDYLPATLTREGLSEPDRGWREGRHHRGAGGACGLQLGAQHRPLSQAFACSWMPSSRNSRPSRIRRSIRSGRRSRCRRRLPDWQRLPAAQQWLDKHNVAAGRPRQVR